MTTPLNNARSTIADGPGRLRWLRRSVLPVLMLALAVGLALAVTACESETTDGDARTESFDLPTELNLQAGAATDVVVGTFAGDATVSTSSTPEGVTATIGSAGDATTITFDVAADAPRGAYSIDVTVSGDGSATETLQFTIVD